MTLHARIRARVVSFMLASSIVAGVFLATATLGVQAGSAAGAPTTDLCGATILSDLRLTNDLVCPNRGLTVGADGVSIELNGHSITGSSLVAPFRGITVVGRTDVEIMGPGTISNFRTGIVIASSSDVEVEHVTVMDNGLAGVADADGIRVLASTNVRISWNFIRGNGDDGVQVSLSTGVKVWRNLIAENGNGVSISPSGNTVSLNLFITNGCGVKGSLDGSTVRLNVFRWNTAKFCA